MQPDIFKASDTTLRLALLACACDRRSALTPAQRDAIVQLGRQAAGVPLDVLLPLREPLLAWCKEYRPRLTAVVSEQLTVLEGRHEAHDQARKMAHADRQEWWRPPQWRTY